MRIHEEQVLHSSVLESGWGLNPDIHEKGELYLDDGFWKLRLRDVADKSDLFEAGSRSIRNTERDPIWVGTATGPKGLTKPEAQEMISAILLSQLKRETVLRRSSMTVSEFVERKFVPEYVAGKGHSGRMHYQSLLKHVVNPEEVDRLFPADGWKRKPRLRSVEDWPYLGRVPLRDVLPASIQNLTSIALSRGYSSQTVAHIRSVISAIFTHAAKQMCFSGENPARPVQLPKVEHMQSPILAREDISRLVNAMGYPEREMALMAIVTGMTVAEICGLRWKRVNLSNQKTLTPANEVFPPRTIAVREEWVRGQLIDVAKKRNSNYNIPSLLLPILQRLKAREEYTDPDDFVLVSRAGSPFNPSNVLARKVKPIGKEMKIPWLSWQHLRRFRRELVAEFGIGFQDQVTGLLHAVSSHDMGDPGEWSSLVETELPY